MTTSILTALTLTRWVEGPHERHPCHSQSRPLQGCGSGRSTFSILNGGHPQQHHPVPQGGPFSKKFWLITGTMPIISTAQPGQRHSTTPTSYVGGASPPPHNNLSHTSPPAGSSTSLTGLEDLCQERSKVTRRERGRIRINAQARWGIKASMHGTRHAHTSVNWLFSFPTENCFDVDNYWTFVHGNFLLLA